MILPSPIFDHIVFGWQKDFIDNGHKYYPGSKLIQSKYLRINSKFGYSGGRLYEFTVWDEFVIDTQEVDFDEIEQRFEVLFQDAKPVFDKLKEVPEIMKEFQRLLKNDS